MAVGSSATRSFGRDQRPGQGDPLQLDPRQLVGVRPKERSRRGQPTRSGCLTPARDDGERRLLAHVVVPIRRDPDIGPSEWDIGRGFNKPCFGKLSVIQATGRPPTTI